jgi:hypothetical protein
VHATWCTRTWKDIRWVCGKQHKDRLPLVRHFEVRFDLVGLFGHPIHQTDPDSFIDARTEECDLAIGVFLELLLQCQESCVFVSHLWKIQWPFRIAWWCENLSFKSPILVFGKELVCSSYRSYFCIRILGSCDHVAIVGVGVGLVPSSCSPLLARAPRFRRGGHRSSRNLEAFHGFALGHKLAISGWLGLGVRRHPR